MRHKGKAVGFLLTEHPLNCTTHFKQAHQLMQKNYLRPVSHALLGMGWKCSICIRDCSILSVQYMYKYIKSGLLYCDISILNNCKLNQCMFYHVFECPEIGCCTVPHQTLQYENIYSAELCNSALDNLDCVKKYLPIQKKMLFISYSCSSMGVI